MNTKLPVVFVTHGSPMLALEPGETGPLLTKLGQDLTKNYKIKTVLVISAHWLTHHQPMVTASEHPKTIHDFSGFPNALYLLNYPVKGDIDTAYLVRSILNHSGFSTKLDPIRGLDHGVWIPLQYLFPKADIPVVQLSMPWPINAKQAIEFGEALQPLRDEGVLIITSGSMTHNLYDVANDDSTASYIAPFTQWVAQTIHNRDLAAMANYRQLAPYAGVAHPTDEHFLPLAIALGASNALDTITELDAGITYRALAMNNYIFG